MRETAALRTAWDRALAAHGDPGIPFDRWTDAVVALVRERRRRMGLPHDAEDVLATLERRALEDLVLSLACDEGSERAWRRLREAYRPRLVGLALRREGRRVDPEDAVDEWLSSLALPPAGGAARTRLGTFDGSGSLWGWLAAGLLHALARRARLRERPAGAVPDEGAASPEAPPWRALLDAEACRSVDDALRAAWTLLEPEERAALVWKHAYGWTQRRIADALGTREDRVSRWVSRGIAKLRGAVEPALPDGLGPRGTSRWEALRHAVSVHLARSAADVALPQAAMPPPEAE
jgi:RNA polymerase sigma factor (sigma-70 family)